MNTESRARKPERRLGLWLVALLAVIPVTAAAQIGPHESGTSLLLAATTPGLTDGVETLEAPAGRGEPGDGQAASSDPAARIARWFGFGTVRLSARYRVIQTSAGVTAVNQLQYRITVDGSLRFDRARRYQLFAGLSTGSTFTSAWSTTGLGTGGFVGLDGLYLKQLHVRAQPLDGYAVQYGGIGVARGESTEITTYDNDAYLTGGRFNVRRPAQLYLDEVTLTWAYLGDLLDPRTLPRLKRLNEVNYYQLLLAKKLSGRLSASAEYTRARGADTLRQAFRLATPNARLVDWFRFEQYFRLGPSGAYGFAVQTEKALGPRMAIGGGYADIDEHCGGLNADKFSCGRRVFANGRVRLSAEFDIELYVGQGVANDFAIANDTRFDVVLNYNLLKTLQRSPWF